MVLRKHCSNRRIVCNRSITGSLNIVLLALACVFLVGCSGTQADKTAGKLECQLQEIELDEKQMNYIKDSLQKLFQWEAYWTYDDDESKSSYSEKANQRASIVVFSLRRGVIVLVPSLGNSVVEFRKSKDGNLSNPRFVAGGVIIDFDGDKLMAMARILGNWREFLLVTGKETLKDLRQFPILMPDHDMKSYIEHNRDTIKYCQTESEMNLLPLTAPTYDPMDERKQALLRDIVKACIELAQTMFTKDKGATVTISVPNFNLNDDIIWVLLEEGNREAYTMSLQLDLMNTDAPVTYMNTVEVRSSPKYGIRIGADEKIKQAPIKVLKYKVR